MSLHGLDSLTLCLLVCSVFTDKTEPTVHLREVVCAEDEHQLTLNVAVTVHVPHGLPEALLTFLKFLRECLQLVLKHMYVTIKPADILTDGIDGLSFVGNLIGDDHQVLQAFLHVALIGLKPSFLLLNLFADLRLLILQRIYSNRRL